MIKIKNLNISFNKEVIYKDFSLTVKNGEKLAIIGESGKGKSTLLNVLVGFIPDFTGKITISGIDLNTNNINKIRKITSWLSQETTLKFKTVEELFFAAFQFDVNKERTPNKEEVDEICSAFELSKSLFTKNVKEISGGQKQRIILASCILLKKPLLLLDEPTSALDQKIKKKVTDYILNKKDLTIITSTHDAYWIEKSDKVIHLK